MIASVVALAVVQAALAIRSPDLTWPQAVAALDAVMVCLALRYISSRADLGPSIGLVLLGGVTASVYDALVSDTGVRLASVHAEQGVVWVVAQVLFAAGCLHPQVASAFATGGPGRQRSESTRLLGTTPVVLVPIALAQLQSGQLLPNQAYLAIAALLAGLAIARGAQTVRASERLARQDPLTGLLNRRGLRTAFQDLVHPVSRTVQAGGVLVVLDLDDFKHVNDTWGHEVGDQLLVAVGSRLSETVPAGSTVCRSGATSSSCCCPRAPTLRRTSCPGPSTRRSPSPAGRSRSAAAPGGSRSDRGASSRTPSPTPTWPSTPASPAPAAPRPCSPPSSGSRCSVSSRWAPTCADWWTATRPPASCSCSTSRSSRCPPGG
ncbi:GGDEF domain-containing protein [Klenkia terrae]|uniref:GGDEF domain-containing protein n=1 Tax=Klenkia terrae TaxID=1052259 RepID=UPI0036189C83